MYLLDSNTCIAVIKNNRPNLVARFRSESMAKGLKLSTVVVHELWFGIANSARLTDNSVKLARFMAPIPLVPFEKEDAITAGEIRAELRRRGTPIGPYDTLIAGQAVRRNLILVTANVGEFARVPGLRWEDWSQPA